MDTKRIILTIRATVNSSFLNNRKAEKEGMYFEISKDVGKGVVLSV